MEDENTTIKLRKSNVKGIDRLKTHPRETYDDVITKMIAFVKANGGLGIALVGKAPTRKVPVKVHT